MKSYNGVKRIVQQILFTQMATNGDVTGLAGEDYQDYEKVLKKYFKRKIFLVDTNITGPNIRNECITNTKLTRIVDCDFCKSYVNAGEELITVFNKMIQQPIKTYSRVLLFTLSLRGPGLNNTLDWLNLHLYDGSLKTDKVKKSLLIDDFSYIRIINHSQITFNSSFLIQYRDSSHMLSGGVLWK
jgi:hypothetical protein